MMGDLDKIVGTKLWLEYFDQNTFFEQAFTPQFVTVLRRCASLDGAEDWYLVKLEVPVDYKAREYDHLMIRSRWVGCRLGDQKATAVFIVLVPNPDELTDPWEMDRSLYIAWGFCARDPADIRRFFSRP